MIRLRFGPLTRGRKWAGALALGLAWLALGFAAGSALAQDTTPQAPAAPWVSPTPDANGVISVVVQPNESLWIIAARAGLTLPDLLALNGLTENDVIRPGDVIIIGAGQPPAAEGTPTAAGPPTATPPPPTPRPTRQTPTATICLIAFEDSNQNTVQDAGEPATPGVAFTVFNRDQVVANVITDGRPEPHCLPDLVPGEYYVTRSVLPGEILTTDGEWALAIAANNTLQQSFGSVRAAATPATAASPTAPAAGAGTVVATAEPPDQSPGSPLNRDAVMWGGVAVLALGGLILLAAVLLLWLRRTDSP